MHVIRSDVAQPLTGVVSDVESLFQTAGLRADPRRHHISVTIPAGATAGDYKLMIPKAEHVMVLDSNARDLALVNQD